MSQSSQPARSREFFGLSVDGAAVSQPFTIKQLAELALTEDLNLGDATTDNLPVLATLSQTALLQTRVACVVSGTVIANEVFHQVDPEIIVDWKVCDGQQLAVGEVIARLHGSMASLLKAERTALNFLQHLSGIATETRRYADAIAGTPAKLTHTRKTTPGLRLLEQQAVVHGGGVPHRFNLGSCVMLKDNHLQAMGGQTSTPIIEAVSQIRQRISHTMKIEVEADTLAQVVEAVEAGADVILLDNMTAAQIREALALIDSRAISEASGGITLETIRAIAETGVDYISTSRITLGAPAIDIGLDFLEEPSG